MTALSCDMTIYLSCPPLTKQYMKSQNGELTIQQLKNREVTLALGGANITLQSRIRNFSLYYKNYSVWNDVSIILDQGSGTTLQCTGNMDGSIFTASVNEDYRCIDSTIYYLDTRYNNAVVKQVDEHLTFSQSSDAFAQFKEEWGIFNLHKLKVDNAQVVTKTTLYAIVNGVYKLLTSTTETAGMDIPILIVPQPPSMAIPLDPDVIAHGFYDYSGGDGGYDYEMALADGGMDYYYPAWCRGLGVNQDLDVEEAQQRYYAVVLHEPPPATQTMSAPPVMSNGEFYGSMAVDPYGHNFYSMKLDGSIFNHLDEVDDSAVAALIGITGANPKYFPVSLT